MSGRRVHADLFRSRLGREPNLVSYQVTQTPGGADVAAVGRGPVDIRRLGEDLAAALASSSLAAPLVCVSRVDRLERHPSGKLRQFVPRS